MKVTRIVVLVMALLFASSVTMAAGDFGSGTKPTRHASIQKTANARCHRALSHKTLSRHLKLARHMVTRHSGKTGVARATAKSRLANTHRQH